MRYYIDLLVILAATTVLAAFTLVVPNDIIRIILGLPFVLFFPGYVLLASLFTRKDSISVMEKVVLSFGLSIAVIPIIGLILNYTPWGLRLQPIFIAIFLFIIVMAIIAIIRRKSVLEAELFFIPINFPVPGAPQEHKIKSAKKLVDIVLNILFALAILFVLGTIIYMITNPRVYERFTEFYVLGADGKAENYPTKVKLGETASVSLGVVNYEQKRMKYSIDIFIAGKLVSSIKDISLDDKEKWQQEVNIKPTETSDKQKVEFLLFKEGETGLYLSLHLLIDVVE
jgi:uncharacterized membrane protein